MLRFLEKEEPLQYICEIGLFPTFWIFYIIQDIKKRSILSSMTERHSEPSHIRMHVHT